MSPLPGSDKYRRPPEESDKPWDDPIVVRANTEVLITSVLNDHFGMDVPTDAERWRDACPFGWEHRDGGIEKQLRVYADTNEAMCFALHGFLTPVRLWKIRTGAPTLKDAARDLLRSYDIQLRQLTYQERFAATRAAAAARPEVTTAAMVEALQVFLNQLPDYSIRQFDNDVLRHVNSTLDEVHTYCAQGPTIEEAQQWLRTTQERLRGVISPSSRSGS